MGLMAGVCIVWGSSLTMERFLSVLLTLFLMRIMDIVVQDTITKFD